MSILATIISFVLIFILAIGMYAVYSQLNAKIAELETVKVVTATELHLPGWALQIDEQGNLVFNNWIDKKGQTAGWIVPKGTRGALNM